MASCAICGKHTSFGNKVTKVRAGLFTRSKKMIKPNLQNATLVLDGRSQRVKACAKCLRTQNKANRIRQ